MTNTRGSEVNIVAIGEPLLEFTERPGDDQPVYTPGFGGDTSNFTVAAARQGARVAYYTRLGSDTFGDRFMELWTREDVDTHAVQRDVEAPSGITLPITARARPRA